MPRNTWEFPLSRTTVLPDWVINTGDVTLLSQYLEEKKSSLPEDDRLYVENVIKCSEKVRLQRENALNALDSGNPVGLQANVTDLGEGGVLLEGIHQNSFQTSGAGCWSCFISNALSAKGLSFSQEEIRSYRPQLSKSVADNQTYATAKDMNMDHVSNAYEAGDLVTELLPNTMLKEIEFQAFGKNTEKVMTKDQYLDNTVNYLKKKIKDSIENEHAPVGILINGHYRTIIGIKGDEVYFKDSNVDSIDKNNDNPDMTHKRNLSSLIESALVGTNGLGIKVNFLEDVQLAKDGKTLLNVPSAHVSMKENGEVVPPPAEIQEMADSEKTIRNQKGINIRRYGGREGTINENLTEFTGLTTDGVIMIERAYIPKTLHAKSLVNSATARSAEEEKRLKDKHNYDINHVADTRKLSESKKTDVIKTSYEEVRKKEKPKFQVETGSQFTIGGTPKMPIDIDKVSKDFKISKEKLEGVKDSLPDIAELLEAIEEFKGLSGKENPKELLAKVHRLNRAISNYPGGGIFNSEQLEELLELSNKAVQNAVTMQRKQNSEAKKQDKSNVL